MDISKLSNEELLALRSQLDTQRQQSAMPPGSESASVPEFMQALDSGVRQVAKGVPVIGSYLDEMNAGTNAMLGQGSYEQNLASERGRDKEFEQKHPYASTALQLGGGVAGGAAALAAAPGIAGAALGNVGKSIAPRVAAGMASGGAIGAGHGFGAGEGGFDQRLNEAARSGATGAGVGAVVPVAASGLSAGVNAIRDRAMTSSAASQLGVKSGALQRVAKDVDADRLDPATIQQRAAELGPEGLMMDYGRNLQGRAEALAGMPGKGQNTVLDAVEGRVRQTADRIGAELDTALGKSPDIVKLADRIDKVYGAKIKPAYDSVMSAHPQVWDAQLEKLTRRPSIKKAIDDAVSLAKESGDDIASPFVAKEGGGLALKPGATPNLAFWDYVKKSLDARIGAIARNPDPESVGKASMSALLDTKRELLGHLDNLTGGAYQQARAMAADKFAVKGALENGLEIFQNKMLPEQFREMIDGMSAVERRALESGARRALERMREVSPSSISEGGSKVYRELLQGGANGDTAQKLRLLLGDSATEKLVGAAMREQGFQSTLNTVAGNSRTAPRLAAQADMADAVAPNLSLAGAVNRAPLVPVENMIGRYLQQGVNATRGDAARLLTAKGGDAQRLAEQLIDFNARKSKRANPALVQSLLMGPSVVQGREADPASLLRRSSGAR